MKRNRVLVMLGFAPLALVLEHVLHVTGIAIFVTSAAAPAYAIATDPGTWAEGTTGRE